MEDLSALEDITLTDTNSGTVRLGDLWTSQPAVVVWLRHYG